MKKIYPIMPKIEVINYNKSESIDMIGLPAWIRREMERVVKLEKVDIRKLSYKRELSYSPEEMRWIDSAEIFLEKTNQSIH